MLTGILFIIDIVIMLMYVCIAIKAKHHSDRVLYFTCSVLWGVCAVLSIIISAFL